MEGSKPTTSQLDVSSGEQADAKDSAAEAPRLYELEPDKLLEMRLPAEQTGVGWVRLFDGQSLFGWDIAGMANWTVTDGILTVDDGEVSLLCTALPWSDYEFQTEFKADVATNSGIFLRTPIFPRDPKTECYELNIAPPDNPFPTGSLVGRKKVELESFDPEQWHTYRVLVEGDTVTIFLDDEELYAYTDPQPVTSGRIGLQHNSGRVSFRNVLARPLGLESLLSTSAATPEGESSEAAADDAQADTLLANWKRFPDMQGSFDLDKDGDLRVQGGKGQLESLTQFGDFALLTRAKTAGPGQNSGIFFRCIPGEEMNGYECQINNDTVDGNRGFPADCGTGGFFRRQDARIIVADHEAWFDLLLIANGPDMAAWVNGIQVSQWQDTREPDPNPRRGLRVEPGTVMIQAHDETTDVSFRMLKVVSHD